MTNSSKSLTLSINDEDVLEFDIDQQDVLLKYPNAPASSLANLAKMDLAIQCSEALCEGVQCNKVANAVVKCTQCSTVECANCVVVRCTDINCGQVLCAQRQCNQVQCTYHSFP